METPGTPVAPHATVRLPSHTVFDHNDASEAGLPIANGDIIYRSGGLWLNGPPSAVPGMGYWQRVGTLLSPVTAGDSVSAYDITATHNLVVAADAQIDSLGVGVAPDGTTAHLLIGTAGSGQISCPGGNLSEQFGAGSVASAGNSVAIGNDAQATIQYSIAVGWQSRATTGIGASAFGANAQATAGGAFAMAYNAQASGGYSVAIGQSAVASSDYAFAMGFNASSIATAGLALGYGCSVTAGYGVAIGTSTAGNYSIAIGRSCSSPNTAGVAIGYSAAAVSYSLALGYCTVAHSYSIVMSGRGATSTAGNQLTLGSPTLAYAINEIRFGGTSHEIKLNRSAADQLTITADKVIVSNGFQVSGDTLLVGNTWLNATSGVRCILWDDTNENSRWFSATREHCTIFANPGSSYASMNLDGGSNATSITSGPPAMYWANTAAVDNSFAKVYFGDSFVGAACAIMGARITSVANNYGEYHFWTRQASGAATRVIIADDVQFPLADSAARGLNIGSASQPTLHRSAAHQLTITASDKVITSHNHEITNRVIHPFTSPAQITAHQDDYNPGTGGAFRLTSDSNWNITGIVADANDGAEIVLINVTTAGLNNIILTHEDASSAAANRIRLADGANLTLTPDDSVTLRYDATTARWRDIARTP